MSRGLHSLRPDLARMWKKLDAAPGLAVFIDKHGHAWQKSAYLGMWYRAFDGDGISVWQLAQNADGETTIHTPKTSIK